MQVAVAFAHDTVALARTHQRGEAGVLGFAPALEGVELVAVGRVVEARGNLRKVLRHRLPYLFRASPRSVGAGARADFEMEAGKRGGDGFDVSRGHCPRGVEPVERGVGLELTHLDGILERHAAAVDAWRGAGAGNGNDVEVDVRREPAVELYFIAAGFQALVEAAEIKEAEVERFLDLVGVFSGEEDVGKIGLDGPDRTGRVIVAGRVMQALDQPGRVGHRVRRAVHGCLAGGGALYSCRA